LSFYRQSSSLNNLWPRGNRLAILLLLLLAFCLRTYQLDDQALRGDEAATVLYSALPVTDLWELSRVTDPHPPLYYLILHPWQWLVGESAWAMRFAGVLASTLAVAVFYRLAQQTLRQPAYTFLAAALLAINPLQIWLAQDIRSYPFMTLLGLLSTWLLWLALHRPHHPPPTTHQRRTTHYELHSTFHLSRFTFYASHFTLYVLLTVACFYIHYYTAFLIAFQALFVLLNIRTFRAKRWAWLTSQVAISLLIIPGLGLAYNFIGQAAGGIEKISTPDILRLASTALLTGFTIAGSWGLWVSLLLLPVWLTGLVTLLQRDFRTGLFWSLFFAVPVLGVIGLSIDRPFFKERFLIQAQPAFELLLAVGFVTLTRKIQPYKFNLSPHAPRTAFHISPFALYALRFTFYASRFTIPALLALLLYANLLALSNYFADPAYAKAPPWRHYHNYVRRHLQPEDVMLTNFPEAAVSYYSPNGLPFYVVPVERDRSVDFRLEETAKIAHAYRRIWFLPLLRQGFDEEGDVLNWLDRHADRIDQTFFPVYHLNLYLSPPAIESLLVSQPATFAHGLHLRGYQILDEKGKSRLTPPSETTMEYLLVLEPEDKFNLSLYWLADGPTPVPYTVFVHLIAADGFNRVGQDNQPVWGRYPTTTWSPGEKVTDKYTLAIPAGAPPGDHRLHVGWYQSDTLERVAVLDPARQPGADHITLNAIIRIE
jgi:4-amino-4-deoxy-L-arabinose transferase-like glycosyltransferase